MITAENFKEFIVKGVQANFEKDFELAPLLFLFIPDKGIAVMEMKASTVKEKDMLADVIIPQIIAKTGATMLATVNEAWARTQDAKLPFDASTPVSQHPDKVEVVMVTIETKVSNEMIMWKIVRPNGASPYLELTETFSKNTQLEGRYANLLGTKPGIN